MQLLEAPEETRADVRIGTASYTVSLVHGDGEEWRRCEADLDAAGITLPLVHRRAWSEALGGRHWLLSARDGTGAYCGAAAVSARTTRAFLGHLMLRVERFGTSNAPTSALRAMLVGLRELVAVEPRVLRVEVAVLSRSPERRAAFREELGALGCAASKTPQAYTVTSAVDLSKSHEEILAGFHATARRHIRAVRNKPVRLRLINHQSHAPAMQALIAETRHRTRSSVPDRPIEAWIDLAGRHPEWLRIVGVFSELGGELLAFACGQMHGDHVVYSDAASVRRDSLKLPLGYAPVWELMRWGKRLGAQWFDFAGITPGKHSDAHDPLGGISDFKRYFRGAIEEVGEEWYFEPHPHRARVARAVSRAANALRAQASLRQA
jgi:hypothetical protein